MRKTATIILSLIFLFSCTEKPAPVAQVTDPASRLAISIQYVAVPQMNVYASPDQAATVDTVYRYGETVSVLSFRGDWAEVRTVDGTGWVAKSELMTREALEQLVETQVPRFLTPPVAIPSPRARGEILLQGKVNTDGEVIDVKIAKNTTGNNQLAVDNANALLNSRFYPLVQKGQRFTFVYEYRVAY